MVMRISEAFCDRHCFGDKNHSFMLNLDSAKFIIRWEMVGRGVIEGHTTTHNSDYSEGSVHIWDVWFGLERTAIILSQKFPVVLLIII